MTTPESLKVLCVDDQSTIRSIVRSMLGQFGIRNIAEAANGMEAIGKLKHSGERPYDLIISDWNMPEVDGVKMFKILKNAKNFEEPPLILLTGHTEERYVRYAIKNGVKFFLAKPFNANALKARVEAAVGPVTE